MSSTGFHSDPSPSAHTRNQILYFVGESDIATTSAMSERVHAHIETVDPGDVVVMDISGVSFSDASSIRAVLKIIETANTCGVSVQIIGAQPSVARLFGIVGLADLFDHDIDD